MTNVVGKWCDYRTCSLKTQIIIIFGDFIGKGTYKRWKELWYRTYVGWYYRWLWLNSGNIWLVVLEIDDNDIRFEVIVDDMILEDMIYTEVRWNLFQSFCRNFGCWRRTLENKMVRKSLEYLVKSLEFLFMNELWNTEYDIIQLHKLSFQMIICS